MIGHYLFTLTKEQEDRVLTHVLKPGPYCGGCLVGTVHGIPDRGRDEWRSMFADGKTWQRTHDPALPEGHLVIGQRWGGSRIGLRYDYLCSRFGTPRVNAAVRNRILSNRARRILGSVAVSVETA